MSNHSFTLDMFGSSTLSSGLGLGVSAFGGFSPSAANDEDPEPTPPAPAPALPVAATPVRRAGLRANFYLDGDRKLSASWKDRARANVAAILIADGIAKRDRPATLTEQAQLIRFTGFGAGELANRMFRRPGEVDFRHGWDDLGSSLESVVSEADYASLARCTQYAHFTPEFIIRAIWAGIEKLGWRGGRVLEPGIGTGLFPALMPETYRDTAYVTGIELDLVTACIVRLLQPKARIINGDFVRTDLAPIYDLAIGNPPFSDRTVRSDRAYRSLGLRLHDYFMARSIDLLKPGALAAFVTSHGTMDKADTTAREYIAKSADLIAAIRLPEGSFRRDAGTDVVVDILFFRKRKLGEPEGDQLWLDVDEVTPATKEDAAIRVNRWFARHPNFVLGTHALTSGPFGESYTCWPRAGDDLEAALAAAINLLPADLYDGEPTPIDIDLEDELAEIVDLQSKEGAVREGSFFLHRSKGLMQMLDGVSVPVTVRRGRMGDGIPEKHVRIISKLIPIRDAVRELLKAQETDRPWRDPQVRLRIAWSSFVRDFGPINHTTVSIQEDVDTDEVKEIHRQPNLVPFRDDPDCWLVASIEDYDMATDTAKPGPIFSERVIAPPSAPTIRSPADALAVVLNERGHVDLEHIAELLHSDPATVVEELAEAIFRDAADGSWQTADGYLSGAVRTKLIAAQAAAELDPSYERNVRALADVQPADLRPSDITARLGAPWIPAADVVAFVKETMEADIRIHHMPELGSWTVEARQLGYSAAGTSEWGTSRRHAGDLLADALNSRVPQIFDVFKDVDGERRVLNVVDTEAARDKLQRIKQSFQDWVWTDPDRTDRLARDYNDRFNNIAPRKFDGSHLKLPGASGAFVLYAALSERGLHDFDAWASCFGDTTTELEIQPSGKYKPVSRFASFVNVPELIAMFRSFADVVLPDDLRQYVKVPDISTGRRQILTAKPTALFKTYQQMLDGRIKAIEKREGPAKPGDDILLSVITDGRHAAIDLRFVMPAADNEADNKLNLLVRNAHRIWKKTGEAIYRRPDGKDFELPGAAQMIFSDLGTINVEKTRGFSAYRFIRDELIRLGVPASQIAFMQDFKKTEAKQRLFGDVRAGEVRFLIGSSETMGTGVNAQLRLKALHHLDVPWLPSQIEQREGRIVRQGNQHDEVDIFAYATEGSLDASMWQNNERKARFIAAALSGDTSIRRLEDVGEGAANQFAIAKAIASGDERLMQKAGLEADIGRLERLRAAHEDDQYAVRRQMRDAEQEIAVSIRRIDEIARDIERLQPTGGNAFTMVVLGEMLTERTEAGRALMKEILSLLQLQQEGEVHLATIGGFDLVYEGERIGKGDGYRYEALLQRTGAEYEVDLAVTVTPLGAISRLEHALDGFDEEQRQHRGRLEDARRRLASYQARTGGLFQFATDLDAKRKQLREVEEDLATEVIAEGQESKAVPLA